VVAQVVGARLHVVRVLDEHVRRQRLAGHDRVATGVRLERPHRGDEHGDIGPKSGHAALHVEEPFGTHVGPEARLVIR